MAKTQERIEELMEMGYEIEEITHYRITDSDGRICGEGTDEWEAWDEAIMNFDSDELRRTKQKLERWNNAVRGNHE